MRNNKEQNAQNEQSKGAQSAQGKASSSQSKASSQKACSSARGRAVESSAQKRVHPARFIEGCDFDPAGSDVDGENPRHAAPPYGRR